MYNYIELQRLYTKSLKPTISKACNPQKLLVIIKKAPLKDDFFK